VIDRQTDKTQTTDHATEKGVAIGGIDCLVSLCKVAPSNNSNNNANK